MPVISKSQFLLVFGWLSPSTVYSTQWVLPTQLREPFTGVYIYNYKYGNLPTQRGNPIPTQSSEDAC